MLTPESYSRNTTELSFLVGVSPLQRVWTRAVGRAYLPEDQLAMLAVVH